MFVQSTSSATDARKNFFALLEQVANDHQVVIIQRRNGENVALISEADLSSLYETAYLLRSPENAQRLFEALQRSQARDRHPLATLSPEQAIAQLRQECDFEQETAQE